MAVLSFQDLRKTCEVYLSNWAYLGVKEEMLQPVGGSGQLFTSFWDNWVLPPDPDGYNPMLSMDATVLQSDVDVEPLTVFDYKIVKSGDGVRTMIAMTNPVDVDAVVLATFHRALFRNSFWDSNLRHSARHISQRLFYPLPALGASVQLNDACDPVDLIIMQAAKAAMMNLQTFLAGLGKSTVENVTMDLSRAHSMVHEVIDDLDVDLKSGIVAWRWQHSPKMIKVQQPLRGPGTWGWGRY